MRGILRFIANHYGKIFLLIATLLASLVMATSSSQVGNAEIDYNTTLQPLAPYIQAEKIVNKELGVLFNITDRVSWTTARNESTMVASVRDTIYGQSAEEFNNFLKGYNVVEILFDYKENETTTLLYRLANDTSLVTLRVAVQDGKITSLLVY